MHPGLTPGQKGSSCGQSSGLRAGGALWGGWVPQAMWGQAGGDPPQCCLEGPKGMCSCCKPGGSESCQGWRRGQRGAGRG